MLDHDHIGTEHLLLGVIHEERGTGARAFATFDAPLERVRERVEQIVGRGEQAPPAHVPFTPRAKKVLELDPVMIELDRIAERWYGRKK